MMSIIKKPMYIRRHRMGSPQLAQCADHPLVVDLSTTAMPGAIQLFGC